MYKKSCSGYNCKRTSDLPLFSTLLRFQNYARQRNKLKSFIFYFLRFFRELTELFIGLNVITKSLRLAYTCSFKYKQPKTTNQMPQYLICELSVLIHSLNFICIYSPYISGKYKFFSETNDECLHALELTTIARPITELSPVSLTSSLASNVPITLPSSFLLTLPRSPMWRSVLQQRCK